jgi:hypothetical protein
VPSSMAETDLFSVFTRKLEELGVVYMVTGSVAGMLYGEPRVTHDVDIVLVLTPGDVQRVIEAFPIDEFYCPPEEVLLEEVMRGQRGHFNLIHHTTGFRADMYLAGRDPLHRWALGERRGITHEGHRVSIAPVEYVIVRKLEFFREGGSEKHLRDIAGILRVSGEDVGKGVLLDWIERLGLGEEWRRASSGS